MSHIRLVLGRRAEEGWRGVSVSQLAFVEFPLVRRAGTVPARAAPAANCARAAGENSPAIRTSPATAIAPAAHVSRVADCCRACTGDADLSAGPLCVHTTEITPWPSSKASKMPSRPNESGKRRGNDWLVVDAERRHDGDRPPQAFPTYTEQRSLHAGATLVDGSAVTRVSRPSSKCRGVAWPEGEVTCEQYIRRTCCAVHIEARVRDVSMGRSIAARSLLIGSCQAMRRRRPIHQGRADHEQSR